MASAALMYYIPNSFQSTGERMHFVDLYQDSCMTCQNVNK